MTEGSCSVSPNQGWTQDGDASCTPQVPFPDTGTRTLPLEHRPMGSQTVYKSAYPHGLVIVWNDSPVSSNPAPLHLRGDTGDQIQVTDDDHRQWPDGIVVWFLD